MNSKVAKELRALLKAVSKVDHEQGGLHADDLLDTCEKIAPSKLVDHSSKCFLLFSEPSTLEQISNHENDPNISLNPKKSRRILNV